MLVTLRQKEHAKATPQEVKTIFWYYDKLLPCVSRKWRRRGTKSSNLCSNVVTRTDEGLVFWILEMWIPIWNKEWDNNGKEDVSIEKKKKQMGRLFMCKEGRDKFTAWNKKIGECRGLPSIPSWENAFKAYAIKAGDNNSTKETEDSIEQKKSVLNRIAGLVDM